MKPHTQTLNPPLRGFEEESLASYTNGELIQGAITYALAATPLSRAASEKFWPFTTPFRPALDPSNNLQKAVSLLTAEIDRLAEIERLADLARKETARLAEIARTEKP